MAKPFYEMGAYVAQVTEQALGKTKNGHPQLVLGIKILGKPDPKNPESYIEIQQYDRAIYRVITDKTIDYVMSDLETLGFTGEGFGCLDPSHPSHESFVGQQVDVWCKIGADLDNNPKEEWQISRKSSGLKVEPLDSKGARELDALFGKHLKKLPKPAKAPQMVGVAAGDPLGIADDDIPF